MTAQLRLTRRRLLGFGAAAASLAGLAGCSPVAPRTAQARVVVVGGGFGGATAAHYLQQWSEGAIAVTVVEPRRRYISCPMSNLVLGGSKALDEMTLGYDALARLGIRVVHDHAVAIAAERRVLRLASGAALPYDRLVVSPGVELLFEQVRGMSEAAARQIPHAWQAGEQTALLRQQLEAMPDGGTVLIGVPAAPYRCPPGPYERACQIASYLKAHKPRAKLIVLDANAQPVAKAALFTRVWREDYAGILEHRPNARVAEVDVATRTFTLESGEPQRGDVLNLIPPMRAGALAHATGLAGDGERWCPVDWMTLESTRLPGVHVLGDATLSAPGMPKSAHMANQHGKAAAAAIVELLAGRVPEPPVMANTCYSMVDDRQAIHVASMHRYDATQKTMVATAGGLSGSERGRWVAEGRYAWGWARSIWADSFG